MTSETLRVRRNTVLAAFILMIFIFFVILTVFSAVLISARNTSKSNHDLITQNTRLLCVLLHKEHLSCKGPDR